ncbi:E3 ubiquitin-protein ligase MARCHF2-like [Chrysoperla carnea]|uniref:E3 ubiquitin-protein ligase MARCHF2-like n=1 Tax=Chrysoperla carnea TaxID=189513 RepID=UPI001D0730B7|nr:E3 ubiquitin-protein ligase MARCHF2-like [Chrysoperla carnea]
MSSNPLNSNTSKPSIISVLSLAATTPSQFQQQQLDDDKNISSIENSSSMSTSIETQTSPTSLNNDDELLPQIHNGKNHAGFKKEMSNNFKKIYTKYQLGSSIKKNGGVLSSSPIKKASISSSASCVCRICQSNTCRERLISPCNCKGTLAYVHLSCLERWLNQSSRSYCELCLFQFNSVLSQRYSLCESLRLWVRHPRNRHNLQSDILITCLLTIVTFGLVIVCLLGMQYFVLEGYKLGVSVTWTRGAISFLLGIVLTGYLITLYLLIRDQFLPWYRWWRHAVNVRLILTAEQVSCNV